MARGIRPGGEAGCWGGEGEICGYLGAEEEAGEQVSGFPQRFPLAAEGEPKMASEG